MNTRYMEFFLKTVELGSISAASQALYISPQGLSQALQQMEKELGDKLFFRQGNKLHLTATGEEAFEAFQQIVEINDGLVEKITASKTDLKQKQRRVTVVAAPIIAMTCLPKVITTFRKRNPEALIKVVEIPPESFFEMEEFGVDTIGIVALPSTMQDGFIREMPEDVSFVRLYSCTQEICMSSRSSKASRKSMDIRDVEKGRVILFGQDIKMLQHLPDGFDVRSVSVQTRNIMLCRSIISAEKNTLGFTNRFVEYYLKVPGLTSVPFVPEVQIDYGYVVNKNSENPLVKDFQELLGNELDLIRKAKEG